MAASFFFYDLETSGFNARSARIMQFAGQRTDVELQPIGEPVNIIIKLSPDTLPDPDAIMVTGITPQKTLEEGITEAEFLEFFYAEVVQPDTTFLGYNSIRFDDEFMRFLHYRNFYDAYEWQWADGCSRWDVLDLVRMTRALRPEGIEWPVTAEGKPTNRLELLTKANNLAHEAAHDALSDVYATIAVAKMIRDKQPQLFDYQLGQRDKKKVMAAVLQATPFIYTSGRYPSASLHTTAAVLLAKHTKQDAALVYDLRQDPTPFLAMSVPEIIKTWQYNPDPAAVRLPVKTLKYNRCPAVAPLGVIKDPATQQRLGLTLDTVTKNLNLLKAHHFEFAEKISQAVQQMDATREKQPVKPDDATVDGQLYGGNFFSKADKDTMRAVRAADPADMGELADNFQDARLKGLLPLYKARNYPAALDSDERAVWDDFCRAQLLGENPQTSRFAQYFNRVQELAAKTPTTEQQYLLEELRLYGESIVPADVTE